MKESREQKILTPGKDMSKVEKGYREGDSEVGSRKQMDRAEWKVKLLAISTYITQQPSVP